MRRVNTAAPNVRMPMRPKYISKINQHLDTTPNVGVKFSDSPVVLNAETVSYKARSTETLYENLHNAKFARITNAGVLESHPHDITITSEAPNYSRPE